MSAIVLILLIGLVAGCKDDPTEPSSRHEPPDAWQYPTLTVSDSVVVAYQYIYDGLDKDAYPTLLHGDFRFIGLEPEAHPVDYGRETELAITDSMFAGGASPVDGYAISALSVEITPLGAWQDIPADDPDFGGVDGQLRTYRVFMYVDRPPGLPFIVSDRADFYLAPVLIDGVEEYRVIGIVDRTHDKRGGAEIMWSGLKEYYRTVSERRS
jgi:hypothetical protein